MTWFAERRNVISEGSGRLSPRVLQILEGNFEQSGGFFVSRITALEFDVKDKNEISFHVNLSTNLCSCFAFQSLKIPCSHAIAAVIKEKISVESLVSEFYNLEKLQSSYAEAVYPICDAAGDIELNVEEQCGNVTIFPPVTRRPPGKPRKNRILSTGEIRMKTPRKRHLCGRCKKSGHSRATCKVAI
ncbi:unnamed protein product [Brassica rapa]|uniref:SWIM-type domain-containing protein n=2 Tax=Brassica TaxID=3705 RepID=A0A8D9HGM3_BRACM|nr:unnamed protein product [Brassica napus]CAG7897424.1 unnamed protein product [Brassica rapa]